MRRILLAIMLASVAVPAVAAGLTPSEQKRIANIEAQIDLVEAQKLQHIANLQAQINFIIATADTREAARRAKCRVPLLWIACPSKEEPTLIPENPYAQFVK